MKIIYNENGDVCEVIFDENHCDKEAYEFANNLIDKTVKMREIKSKENIEISNIECRKTTSISNTQLKSYAHQLDKQAEVFMYTQIPQFIGVNMNIRSQLPNSYNDYNDINFAEGD